MTDMIEGFGALIPSEYCNGKVCYDKRTAVTAQNHRYHEDHILLRIYQCPECNHFHLTKKDVIKKKKNHHLPRHVTDEWD